MFLSRIGSLSFVKTCQDQIYLVLNQQVDQFLSVLLVGSLCELDAFEDGTRWGSTQWVKQFLSLLLVHNLEHLIDLCIDAKGAHKHQEVVRKSQRQIGQFEFALELFVSLKTAIGGQYFEGFAHYPEQVVAIDQH